MDTSNTWETFTSANADQQVTLIMREIMRAVIDKGPEYIYINPAGDTATYGGISCQYVDHGNRMHDEPPCPSCLVGRVLHALGMPLEALASEDTESRCVSDWQPAGVKPPALMILTVVQRVQDNGGTWGLCKQAAEAIRDTYLRVGAPVA